MSHKLKISDSLSLPSDATTQALAWLGRRGSGKSYGASKLAELLNEIGAQFVAIDPVGIWYGLRLGKDGKSRGLDIPIFGGLHGDVPLEAGGGALIADLIVSRNISAVLDVSQFEADADKARFTQAFADRFFFLKKSSPSAVHVFVEEAQEFIPQNIQKGEERMLHSWQRMIRLGRNYGIGVSMISQRPQDVNKKALNQAECLFCFQLTGPQERDAVEKWISEHGLQEDLQKVLPKLQQGHAHVWSPVWLDFNSEVLIAEKQTFAAGSTPKVGAKPVKTISLEPLELEQLRKDMAATIERHKENDPRELKKQVADLKKELAKKLAVGGKTVTKEVQVVDQRTIAQALKKRDSEWLSAVKSYQSEVRSAAQLAAANISKFGFTPPGAPEIHATAIVATTKIAPVTMRQAQRRTETKIEATGDITRSQMALLAALSEAEGIGRKKISRSFMAFIAGVSAKSSSFINNLSALRSRGLIDYGAGSTVFLTTEGRAIAPANDSPMDEAEMFSRIEKIITSPQTQLLRVLRNEYPNAVQRDELAAKAGVSPQSSSFINNVSALSGRELAEYPERGMVRLQDWVMLQEQAA